ncbi:MAG: hypothetical protein GWM90_08225 [Gemmatimonadetes bacterium]|nr:hypothetical protein [Gemmatimonadota bacterium]NIQ52420.1 hypothetical protein [Gemmatimonadota bacterium]NIU72549.1 hypothetical protein [Gammaproteobacteria bacterium]NIX44098.1 hypothetical protein [Gemmatimonadota bacterium]
MSGADVRLAAGTATAILTEALPGASSCLGTPFPDPSREPDPAGPGCYVGVVPGGVGAGTEYALHITLVDGTVVTGRTTPPARLRIESPHRDSVYRLQARLGAVEAVLRVRWEGGPHGVLLSAPRARTVFRADSVVAVDETCELHLSRRPVLDVVDDGDPVAVAVARCRAVDADDGFGWDSLRSDIGLTAMDSAYAEYRDVVLGRGSVALERAGPGLDGAVGVFGSVARSRPSYLLLPPP